jgi:hypothetical protein
MSDWLFTRRHTRERFQRRAIHPLTCREQATHRPFSRSKLALLLAKSWRS